MKTAQALRRSLPRLRLSALRRALSVVASVREAYDPPQPRPEHSDAPYRVLFVCHGNILRSPIAEGIFRRKLAAEGLYGRVMVDSAGTAKDNVGRHADPRARLACLRRRGPIGDLRARAFCAQDFERFDEILVLDEYNRRDVLAYARNGLDRDKVRLLLDYLDGGEVADPVNGTQADVERTYDVIDRACGAFLRRLAANLSAIPCQTMTAER